MKRIIRGFGRIILKLFAPRLFYIENNEVEVRSLGKNISDSFISLKSKIFGPAQIGASSIGDYTYISKNAQISLTEIGKFCSIGPNFCCGWGIHPVNGISTSPMFYSNAKQVGITFCEKSKIEERKRITIGNDVFIGMNVTILDGVTIGDGAIIGAGTIVSKDIPAYAIAVGSPVKVIKYRFNEAQIEALLQIKWWNFAENELQVVEKYFFEIDEFINRYHGRN